MRAIKPEMKPFRWLRELPENTNPDDIIDISELSWQKFESREEYIKNFEEKIFKCKNNFYTFYHEDNFKKRYIGENLVALIILEIIHPIQVYDLRIKLDVTVSDHKNNEIKDTKEDIKANEIMNAEVVCFPVNLLLLRSKYG